MALVAFTFAASPAFGASSAETLSAAEAAFDEGVALRGDAANARPAFARAAAGYDVLWDQGYRTPDLALNRSRAHRLAGNLPRSVAALHEGLAVARFSRPLRVELEDARAVVQFPLEGELATQCRTHAVRGVSTRLSTADVWFLGGFGWLVACAGVARYVMTRNVPWLLVAAVGLICGGALAVLWIGDARDRERDESFPLLIVSEDTTLRRGNAPAYPPRLDGVLPKGAEVRELTRRGGWVQVQLPGGTIGWVPGSAVIACSG